MYCPACGNFISTGLNFCNSCGSKVKPGGEPVKKSGNPLPFLAAALCVIDVAALFVFALMLLLFLDKNVDGKVIATVSTFYLAMLALTNIAFIRMISRLVKVHIENNTVQSDTRPPRIFEPATPQIEAARQPVVPVGSVTDHTTRTLDEVLLKEK